MTSTALVETSSTFPAAPDRSRLLDAFFSGRNERTLAAYRAGLAAVVLAKLQRQA